MNDITPGFVVSGLKREIEKIVQEEADAAAIRTRDRIRAAAGEIAVAILKDVRMQLNGEELIIRVDTRKL